MMEDTIRHIVVCHKHLKKVKDLYHKKKLKWIFFGDSPILREKIIEQLGDENRFYYAETLKTIARNKKNEFLQLIADFGKLNNNYHWWSTVLSYKSPLSTNVFTNYCYIAIINQLLNETKTNYLIIIENPFLYKDIQQTSQNSHTLFIESKMNFLKFKLIAVSFLKVNYFLIKALKTYLVTKRKAIKYKRTINNTLNSEKFDIAICTWIEERSFNKENGKFNDPYLKEIYNFLDSNNKKWISITLPLFSTSLLDKVFKSGKVIPILFFGNIKNIVQAYLKILRFRIVHDKTRSDLKLNIFDYELLKEKGRLGETILHYILFKKLLKSELKFQKLLYPFENQPFEKMMCLALYEGRADVKSYAYQHTSVPDYLMNYYLGKGEELILPQPDYIIASSKYFKSVLSKAGYTSRIYNGGSLRFGGYIKKDKVSKSKMKSNSENNVLVILSYSVEYSLDLLFYLIRNNVEQKHFLIKPHPDFPESIIIRYISKFPKNFKFVSGQITQFFTECDWAIHNGSNGALEAFNAGLSIMKYLPERVDLDSLTFMEDWQKIIQDKDQLDFSSIENNTDLGTEGNIEPLNSMVWKELLL
jgi:hypothetical protein